MADPEVTTEQAEPTEATCPYPDVASCERFHRNGCGPDCPVFASISRLIERRQEPTIVLDAKAHACMTLFGIEFSPMNEVQRKAWEDKGVMVCPHGGHDWRRVEPTYHWWDHGGGDEPKGGVAVMCGGFEYPDEAVSFEWLECDCKVPDASPNLPAYYNGERPDGKSWLPPDDLQFDYS